MPCNSDYLEPTRFEKEVKATAELLYYVDCLLGRVDDVRTKLVAKATYPTKSDGDYVVSRLCETISSFTDEQMDAIVYNARSKKSRQLADWWEAHQEADKKRIQEEINALKDDEDIKKALSKLTQRERNLLGL